MNNNKANITARCIWTLFNPSAFEVGDILISLGISKMTHSKPDKEDHLMKDWGSIYQGVRKIKEIHDGQLPWSWQQQKVVTIPGPQETNEGTVSGRAAALEKYLVGQGMQLLTT